jgi:ribonuclease E
VVIDFIDMVLESNRELVLRRLTECLGRDRTKHQVTEITSLGLVQMTRKRIGSGLLEAFSETCDHCKGRGVMIHTEPVPEKRSNGGAGNQVKAVAAATRTEPAQATTKSRRRRGGNAEPAEAPVPEVIEEPVAAPHDGESPMAIAADLPSASGSGVAGSGFAGSAVAGSAVAGSGVAGSGVAGSGVVGSGIVSAAAKAAVTADDNDDDYDISGYDLSRYEAPSFDEPAEESEPLRLVGSDDPDAADEDDEDDDSVSAGAGGRRRSRRGGTRRRTRP